MRDGGWRGTHQDEDWVVASASEGEGVKDG